MMVYMEPVMLLKAIHSYLAVSRVRGIWKTGRQVPLTGTLRFTERAWGGVDSNSHPGGSRAANIALAKDLPIWNHSPQLLGASNYKTEIPCLITQAPGRDKAKENTEKQNKTTARTANQNSSKDEKNFPTHPDFMERYLEVSLPHLADTGHVCTCSCVQVLVMLHVYVQEHVCIYVCVWVYMRGWGREGYMKFCGQVHVCVWGCNLCVYMWSSTCTCRCTYVHMHAWTCTCGGQGQLPFLFLKIPFPYSFRKYLSLNQGG